MPKFYMMELLTEADFYKQKISSPADSMSKMASEILWRSCGDPVACLTKPRAYLGGRATLGYLDVLTTLI